MKLLIRAIVSVFLFFLFLIALIAQGDGPKINIILAILILAILIVYNIKVSSKFSFKTKTIVIAALSISCLAYLAFPKRNAMCSVPADGVVCSSHYCIGLPVMGSMDPICYGYAFDKKYYRP